MNRTQPAPRHIQETALCLLFDEAPDALDGHTYVQKLMFLFQQRADENWFAFEAGDYGPFCRELYQVMDYCIEHDYVSKTTSEDKHGRVRYHYDAGPAIGDVLGHGDREELRDVARGVFEDYPTDSLPALLDAVYREYPVWTRNSVY